MACSAINSSSCRDQCVGLWPLFGAFKLTFGAFCPFWRPIASAINEFISSCICNLIPNIEDGSKKGSNIPNAWKMCESVRRNVWKCIKVCAMNLLAQGCTFGYPTCWNCLKNVWNSPNYVKVCKCVKECVNVCNTQNTACICIAGPVPTIPQTPKMNSRRLLNQCDTHTDSCWHSIHKDDDHNLILIG